MWNTIRKVTMVVRVTGIDHKLPGIATIKTFLQNECGAFYLLLNLCPAHVPIQDCEYKRNGTRNLFMFVEPKAGSRHVLVTNRRTKQDFAFAMRYLVDVIYPDDEGIIDVVSDNLNTHHYHSLVEFFGKQEADRIMNRLEFHHTPKHASCLPKNS